MKCTVCLNEPQEGDRNMWFQFNPKTLCCQDKSTYLCAGCKEGLRADIEAGKFDAQCWTCRKPIKRTRTNTFESQFTEVKERDLKGFIRACEESRRGEKRRKDAELAKPGQISEELQREKQKYDQDRRDEDRLRSQTDEEYARRVQKEQEEEDRRAAAARREREEMDEATRELIKKMQEEEEQDKESEQKRLEQEEKDRKMALELQAEEREKEANRKMEADSQGAQEGKKKRAKVEPGESAGGAIKIEDDVSVVTED